jgi:hypothetical protein
MKKIFFIAGWVIMLSCILSCKKDNATVKDKELTYEKIKGKWYLLDKDPDAVMSVDFISSDTCMYSIYNGPEEIQIMTLVYSFNNGHLVMTQVPVTGGQNSLQIMAASDMDFIALSDETYLENDNLVFIESKDKYSYTREMPKVSGGSITGTISVNGNFGKGTVGVAAMDPSTEKGGLTFLMAPGKYYCQGLPNGKYVVFAIYIPVEHASDYESHEVTEFPYDTYQSQIAISNGKTVSDINLEISLPVTTKSQIKKSGQIHEILWKKLNVLKYHKSLKKC